MMNKTVKPPNLNKNDQPGQILFIDGHKITIQYSREKNPSAIKAIKDTLLAGKGVRKG